MFAMVGGPGMWEILLILLIIVIIFGAKKLPEIGSGLGKGITNFKKAMRDQDHLNSNSADSEEKETRA
jgi:sec-independent protein translocase protein TatA